MEKKIEIYNGYVVKTIGDAFFAVFADPVEALKCAVDIQQKIITEKIDTLPGVVLQARTAMHTGKPVKADDENDYIGRDINKAARIAGVCRGG